MNKITVTIYGILCYEQMFMKIRRLEITYSKVYYIYFILWDLNVAVDQV